MFFIYFFFFNGGWDVTCMLEFYAISDHHSVRLFFEFDIPGSFKYFLAGVSGHILHAMLFTDP